MTPKISVIMSAYNTEGYVGAAIESIRSQTFGDYEFIVIDNGSTDKTGEIIDAHARQDERMVVVHNHENTFISQARNQALKMVTGKYVYVIDSDDWAEPAMLQDMYTCAETYHADVVITGFYMEYDFPSGLISYEVRPGEAQYTTQQSFRENAYRYFNRSFLTVPWNKLYRAAHIAENHIAYRNTKLEDHHFNMDFLMDATCVCFLDKAYYHYMRERPGADSACVYSDSLYKKKKEHMQHVVALYAHWDLHDEASMRGIAEFYAGRLVQCIQETMGKKNLRYQEKRMEIERILHDDLSRSSIQLARPESRKMRMCLLPMQWDNITLCMCMGGCIDFIKKHFSTTFYRMRAKEVHRAAQV